MGKGPHDPTILFLSVRPEELKAQPCPLHLFAIARRWKQPKCKLTEEWIHKMWYMFYNGILCPLQKERNSIRYNNMMNLEDTMLPEINQLEKDKYCLSPLT